MTDPAFSEFRHQLEVNLVAPLLVTQVFASLLGTDRTRQGQPGRIVNISSVGGKIGVPFLGAYVASKHGLEGMSESLRRELLLYGIDLIVIGPGSVATSIWDKAESADINGYQGTEYAPILDRFRKYFIAEGRKGLPPDNRPSGPCGVNHCSAQGPLCRCAATVRELDPPDAPAEAGTG